MTDGNKDDLLDLIFAAPINLPTVKGPSSPGPYQQDEEDNEYPPAKERTVTRSTVSHRESNVSETVSGRDNNLLRDEIDEERESYTEVRQTSTFARYNGSLEVTKITVTESIEQQEEDRESIASERESLKREEDLPHIGYHSQSGQGDEEEENEEEDDIPKFAPQKTPQHDQLIDEMRQRHFGEQSESQEEEHSDREEISFHEERTELTQKRVTQRQEYIEEDVNINEREESADEDDRYPITTGTRLQYGFDSESEKSEKEEPKIEKQPSAEQTAEAFMDFAATTPTVRERELSEEPNFGIELESESEEDEHEVLANFNEQAGLESAAAMMARIEQSKPTTATQSRTISETSEGTEVQEPMRFRELSMERHVESWEHPEPFYNNNVIMTKGKMFSETERPYMAKETTHYEAKVEVRPAEIQQRTISVKGTEPPTQFGTFEPNAEHTIKSEVSSAPGVRNLKSVFETRKDETRKPLAGHPPVIQYEYDPDYRPHDDKRPPHEMHYRKSQTPSLTSRTSSEQVQVFRKQPEPVQVFKKQPEPVQVFQRQPEQVHVFHKETDQVQILYRQPDLAHSHYKQPDPALLYHKQPQPTQIYHRKPEVVETYHRQLDPAQLYHKQTDYYKQYEYQEKPEPIPTYHKETEYHKQPEPTYIYHKQPEPVQTYQKQVEYHKHSEPTYLYHKQLEPVQVYHKQVEYHKQPEPKQPEPLPVYHRQVEYHKQFEPRQPEPLPVYHRQVEYHKQFEPRQPEPVQVYHKQTEYYKQPQPTYIYQKQAEPAQVYYKQQTDVIHKQPEVFHKHPDSAFVYHKPSVESPPRSPSPEQFEIHVIPEEQKPVDELLTIFGGRKQAIKRRGTEPVQKSEINRFVHRTDSERPINVVSGVQSGAPKIKEYVRRSSEDSISRPAKLERPPEPRPVVQERSPTPSKQPYTPPRSPMLSSKDQFQSVRVVKNVRQFVKLWGHSTYTPGGPHPMSPVPVPSDLPDEREMRIIRGIQEQAPSLTPENRSSNVAAMATIFTAKKDRPKMNFELIPRHEETHPKQITVITTVATTPIDIHVPPVPEDSEYIISEKDRIDEVMIDDIPVAQRRKVFEEKEPVRREVVKTQSLHPVKTVEPYNMAAGGKRVAEVKAVVRENERDEEQRYVRKPSKDEERKKLVERTSQEVTRDEIEKATEEIADYITQLTPVSERRKMFENEGKSEKRSSVVRGKPH